jgi:hypothetical protein
MAPPGEGFTHEFSAIPVRGRTLPGIQTRLTVNAPGDRHEQEADRVAGEIMRIPEAGTMSTTPLPTDETPVQAKPSSDGPVASGGGEASVE